MKAIVGGIILLLLPAVARADILEWQDVDGVKHYTNLKGEVPKEHRDGAQVVVDEQARVAESGSPAMITTAPPASPSAPPPEERREAQVIYDRRPLSRAYLDGLERGLELARGTTSAAGGSVQINGPLAVAKTSGAAPYSRYLDPYYYPFVTTSFDRGRSRHLTLRMLLEEQFALDRAAPFVFEERFIPPFGHPPLDVDLNPFLPRGLPHGFPRDVRVIAR